MNRKGFTLVELLAVIVILSGISLIVVSSVTSSLGRREEKECEEQIQLAKNAAKIYFSLTGKTEVCVYTLICDKYISENSKYDKLNYSIPKDTSKCEMKTTECTDGKITLKNGDYVYNKYDKKNLKNVCDLS